jgi:hypothetical protein
MLLTNLLLLSGCTFDENLEVRNLRGTVVVPRAAATRSVLRPDDTVEEVTDVRLIGPVYLGLYPGMLGANEFTTYPHPSVGPTLVSHPYGGTSIGDMRFPCFESLVCKLTSGRFESYDSILTWFNDTVGLPVVDAVGDIVDEGVYMQQTCFDLLEVVSDEEVRLTAYEDRNADGKLNAQDLDFVENADGDFEGEFTIWQQEMFYEVDDTDGVLDGMQLWGFMDAPSDSGYNFATCVGGPGAGFFAGEYAMEFYGGFVSNTVLNSPSNYLVAEDHDWVASESFEWTEWGDQPRLVLDWEVL